MVSNVDVILTVRDILRTYLTDAYATAGGQDREFIYTDKPRLDAKMPRVFISKISSPNQMLNIGTDYSDRRFVPLEIFFYTKRDFKITVSDVEYKNELLVEYYLDQIGNCLKAYQTTTQAANIPAFKVLNTTNVNYDEEHQIYRGSIIVQYYYFKLGTSNTYP